MSFTDVISGHATLAADVNQLVDALNGTTAGALFIQGTAATTAANPINAVMPSQPGSDADVVQAYVLGDTLSRATMYIRGSDHYGGFAAGLGTSTTAHLFAQAGGWRTPENLTIDGSLTAGGTTLSSLNDTGNATIGGTLGVSGATTLAGLTAGAIGASSITLSGNLSVGGNITITGTAQVGGQTICLVIGGLRIFVGPTAPVGGFSDGDVYIKG